MNLQTDIDIEQNILGSMFIDQSCIVEFFNLIQTLEVFSDRQNFLIAESIKRQYDKGDLIDITTIAKDLQKNGTLKEAGGSKYIVSISSRISSTAHFEIHTRLLLEAYMKKGVARFSQHLLSIALSETSDVFEQVAIVQTGLESLLNQSIIADEQPIGEILIEESLKWQQENKSGMAGISTGIIKVDEAIGGLVETDLIVLGARPGQGKTAFALSILRNLCKQNIPCGIFSLEMGRSQLVQRLISQESDVFAYKIRNNDLDNFDRQRLFKAMDEVKNWPIQINDNAGITIRQLKTKATLWKKKYGIKFLVVDYLQLMSGDTKRQNREGEISEISRGLKVLAKDLKIPIMALSQLSRSVESRTTKIPQLSDLRESGAIEQDADTVLFLMRPEYYKISEMEIDGTNQSTEGLCLLEVAKFRPGNVGQYGIRFNGPLMKFTNYNNDNGF